jgi:hypothetical protein
MESAFPSTSENGINTKSAKSPLSPAERQARIERIRRQIAAGDYDTPEKFALALDKLLRQLGLD